MHGGREHVVALKSDGTVWTWGSNVEGQQGRGTTANTLVAHPRDLARHRQRRRRDRAQPHRRAEEQRHRLDVRPQQRRPAGRREHHTASLPVQVTGIADAVGIAAGRDMSYAIRSGGQLWAWGRNDEGQLGDGTTTRRLTPVRVGPAGTFTNVKTLTGGRDHGVAVRTMGRSGPGDPTTTHRWATASTTDRLLPVAIDINGSAAGLGTASDAAAGAHHSYALRTDGTVAAWGRNYRAEIGNGTQGTVLVTRPVSVLGVSDAVTIGAGRDMGNVTLSDGRVKSWGHNLSGQLGDGTTTNRTSAVFVPGITNAVKASGGGSAYGVVLVGDSTTPPPNEDPVANITGTTCTDLTCPLSGATSTDDGSIASYAGASATPRPVGRQPRSHLRPARHLHGDADRHRRRGCDGHGHRRREPDRPDAAARRGSRRAHHGHHLHRPDLPAERSDLDRRRLDLELRVELRRHHHRHGGQPGPHLRPGRRLHGDARPSPMTTVLRTPTRHLVARPSRVRRRPTRTRSPTSPGPRATGSPAR